MNKVYLLFREHYSGRMLYVGTFANKEAAQRELEKESEWLWPYFEIREVIPSE